MYYDNYRNQTVVRDHRTTGRAGGSGSGTVTVVPSGGTVVVPSSAPQPSYAAPPGYPQQAYPPAGYPQQMFPPPGYSPYAGYPMPGYPGYDGNPCGAGMLLRNLNLANIVDLLAQAFAAFGSLPAAPSTSGESQPTVADEITYLQALAQHAKRDEQIRLFGAGARALLGGVYG